jgi:hypothetical protein
MGRERGARREREMERREFKRSIYDSGSAS